MYTDEGFRWRAGLRVGMGGVPRRGSVTGFEEKEATEGYKRSGEVN